MGESMEDMKINGQEQRSSRIYFSLFGTFAVRKLDEDEAGDAVRPAERIVQLRFDQRFHFPLAHIAFHATERYVRRRELDRFVAPHVQYSENIKGAVRKYLAECRKLVGDLLPRDAKAFHFPADAATTDVHLFRTLLRRAKGRADEQALGDLLQALRTGAAGLLPEVPDTFIVERNGITADYARAALKLTENESKYPDRERLLESVLAAAGTVEKVAAANPADQDLALAAARLFQALRQVYRVDSLYEAVLRSVGGEEARIRQPLADIVRRRPSIVVEPRTAVVSEPAPTSENGTVDSGRSPEQVADEPNVRNRAGEDSAAFQGQSPSSFRVAPGQPGPSDGSRVTRPGPLLRSAIVPGLDDGGSPQWMTPRRAEGGAQTAAQVSMQLSGALAGGESPYAPVVEARPGDLINCKVILSNLTSAELHDCMLRLRLDRRLSLDPEKARVRIKQENQNVDLNYKRDFIRCADGALDFFLAKVGSGFDATIILLFPLCVADTAQFEVGRTTMQLQATLLHREGVGTSNSLSLVIAHKPGSGPELSLVGCLSSLQWNKFGNYGYLVVAAPGDELAVRATLVNTGHQSIDDAGVRIRLPDGVRAGTAKMYDADVQGQDVDTGALVSGGLSTGRLPPGNSFTRTLLLQAFVNDPFPGRSELRTIGVEGMIGGTPTAKENPRLFVCDRSVQVLVRASDSAVPDELSHRLRVHTGQRLTWRILLVNNSVTVLAQPVISVALPVGFEPILNTETVDDQSISLGPYETLYSEGRRLSDMEPRSVQEIGFDVLVAGGPAAPDRQMFATVTITSHGTVVCDDTAVFEFEEKEPPRWGVQSGT